MSSDLHLIGTNHYSILILLFFATYIPTQPVSVVLMRKMGARAFLSTTTLVFGGLTIAMGFATSWTHQIPIRLLLGVFENGILPGVAYLTRCVLENRNSFRYRVLTACGH